MRCTSGLDPSLREGARRPTRAGGSPRARLGHARALATLTLVGTIAATGCGAAAREIVPVVSSPFTEAHAALFDDGMDLVRDPRMLDGHYLETWEDELDQRVGEADLVAVVTIRTLRTDVDLDRRQTYRLIGHVDRAWLGEVGEELMLAVREGQRGFALVRTNERRLLDEQYIAFVKWAEEEDGSVRARWHLSPATEQVALRVRARLEHRRNVRADDSGARRRVIIHRN